MYLIIFITNIDLKTGVRFGFPVLEYSLTLWLAYKVNQQEVHLLLED
ncbi:MAG: hypothetical protein GX240_02690 [Candidatus Atribacteria bacterium]|jgi:hypothetical protein|nr:hypothetical protein [Candidatus Atribacteria bacterium]